MWGLGAFALAVARAHATAKATFDLALMHRALERRVVRILKPTGTGIEARLSRSSSSGAYGGMIEIRAWVRRGV
jgi:hypothetical protein